MINTKNMTNAKNESTRQRLHRLAWVLDNSIPVPGLGGYRIGVDGFIGLIPGIGDAVGALLSSYILAEAVRLGVPKTVLLRMYANMLVDSVVGLIPLAGDVFDVTWKSNLRNVNLLDTYLENPQRTTTSSRWFAVGFMAAVLLLLVVIVVLAMMVLGWVLSLLTG